MGNKIKWNLAAFNEIRTMPATQAAINGAADRVRQRAEAVSPSPVVRRYQANGRITTANGKSRYRVYVRSADYAASYSQQKHNTLLKALGGG
ncbi:hypothetical protein [Corynebacterium striatum]|uniref:hypothetical protein n=1 Tax=Corynebacterium striatum TaxID=43770 RepID=UPI003B5913D5